MASLEGSNRGLQNSSREDKDPIMYNACMSLLFYNSYMVCVSHTAR